MKKLLFFSLFLSSCWGDDGGIYYAKAILSNKTDYNLEINAYYKKKNVKKIVLTPKKKIEFFITDTNSSFLEGYPIPELDSINIVFNNKRILVESCGENIFNPNFCPHHRFNSNAVLVGKKLSYFKKHNDEKVYRNSITLSITEEDYKKAIPL